MPEQTRPPDQAGQAPVNTVAGERNAPLAGPVPTGETTEARMRRENVQGPTPERRPEPREVKGDEEPAQMYERKPSKAEVAHGKWVQTQGARAAALRDDTPGVLGTDDPLEGEKFPRPKGVMKPVGKPKGELGSEENPMRMVIQTAAPTQEYEGTEEAQRWYRLASSAARRDQIIEGELARERGEYAGMNTGNVYGASHDERVAAMKSLDLPPEGVVEVVDAIPRGFASRSSPETRGGF